MRLKIYNFLVNRVPGIKSRYHDYHDGGNKFHNIVSYFYLIYLNFAYYILHFKWLGEDKTLSIFEEKKLSIQCPESQLIKHPAPMELVERLLKYDVISFDIFDTLIFRPFSEPVDLFYFIGQKLGYMDFKHIRIECERDARQKKYLKCKSYEVNLEEIWQELELELA